MQVAVMAIVIVTKVDKGRNSSRNAAHIPSVSRLPVPSSKPLAHSLTDCVSHQLKLVGQQVLIL